jgi:hypothetical protein
MFKKIAQIGLGILLVVQMTGCVYYSGDRHYHPYWYHHHDDAVVVVHG